MTKEYLVHIVAVDENNGIGFKDQLLFRIKEDLQNFKKLTMGCAVIAGSKTINTMPNLVGRSMYRFTRNADKPLTGKLVNNITNIKGWLDGNKSSVKRPVFIIGGGEVYKETLNDVSVIVLTRIHGTAENCDTWYPDFLTDRKPLYCTESSRHVDPISGLEYSFHIYGYDREDLKHFLQHKAKADRNERKET